jgi:hypothetical protein
MIILRRETAIALLEEKVVRVCKNMVEGRRAAETNRIPGSQQLTRMVGIRTKDYGKSETSSIIHKVPPTMCD